ncbi:Alkaline phosphatase [hydrothermal vent metagenome]|uniref:Alkaline phosphatase n=1 Tax=hydrothermal vent metagenome TaxID=652676 RepID=A0A3B0YNL8_9ZZZZ
MNKMLFPPADCWHDKIKGTGSTLLLASLLLLSFMLAAIPAPVHAMQGQPAATRAFAAGEVIVRFNEGVSAATQAGVLNAAGCQETGSLGAVSNLMLANVASGQSVAQTVAALNANANVAYAEPNFIVTAQVIPNDPLFPDLWGLDNTGQTAGTPDADIDGPEAWDIQTGTRVVVAVIDTGLDYNHEDIVGNVWVNTGEIAGNGIDDDNNGFIDDDKGWDFANNDNDPFDDNGHGTHVSGTVAAVGNNAIGVTGVNWSAQIMPLKFLDANGAGTAADAISAIQYATMMGAPISNNSWGGGAFSQALFDAIQAAGNAGQLFVAAAGNDAVNTDVTPSYPASYNLNNIISVAATDDNDLLATFSNFGVVSVDLGAPGVDILSTTPPAAAGGGGGMGGMGGMGAPPPPTTGASTYSTFSGTSMASPHVAGTAALVLASNPGASVAEVKDAVLSGTDPIAALAGITVTGGRLNAFGSVAGQGITITPNTATVVVAATQQFTANGGQGPYTWTVADPAVGTIDPATGLFTAVAVGTTTISATDDLGEVGTSGTITVVNAPPVVVTLTPATATLTVGDTQQFAAAGGAAPYTWSVSNPAVISVNAAGLVTALAAGTATVTATDANGVAGSATVTVNAAPANIVITPNTATVPTGGTQQFTANGGVAPYTWSLSTEDAGTIDAVTGLFTAGDEAATTTVIATDANGDTGESGTITVVVAAAPPPGGGMGGGMGMGM